MSLNSSICQLNSVWMLLKEKEQWNKINNEHYYDANLLSLQCDLNNDIEKNDLLETFEY